jgi:hypothetical protein
MAPLDVSSISLGPVVNNAGNKIIPIYWLGMEPQYWIPEEPLRVIWHPKGYDDPDANRVTVGFELTQEVQSFIESLSEILIHNLADDSLTYFGKVMTKAEIQMLYLSPLRVSSKGHKSLRAKFTHTGRNQLRYWDDEKKVATPPNTSWVDRFVKPRFLIGSLWMMGNQVGIVVELTDVKFVEEELECPF